MDKMKQRKKLATHFKHLFFLLTTFCFFLRPISSCLSKDIPAPCKLAVDSESLKCSEYGGGSLPMVILSNSRSCGAVGVGRCSDMVTDSQGDI